MHKPVKVAVTGAAGQIAYELLFRIANGNMLGPDQPVSLTMLEIPDAVSRVSGVMMELDDCAFDLLHDMSATADPDEAFRDADIAMLVGARPRGPGMERSDLLAANGEIFEVQGRALNAHASRDVRVLVVGNPANTNALIAMHNAPDLDPGCFSAMTRLDHNRALQALANKTGARVGDIRNLCVWGNHSATQFPDISYATIAGKPALDLVPEAWVAEDFIPGIQKRGAEVIAARGNSSAASAANAASDHMRLWMDGTPEGDWTSMVVRSDGSYGIPEGLMYSVPVTTANGGYSVVQGLEISDFSRTRIDANIRELNDERDAVSHLMGAGS